MSGENWRHVACLGTASLGMCFMVNASADSQDTVNLNAGYSILMDSNVFRLPDNATGPSGMATKSDRVKTSTLGLSIDKSYSLQRFVAKVNAVDARYDNFGYLGFSTVNYDAAWRWSITPRVHGNLATAKTTALNSYTDFRNTNARNLRTLESTNFDAEAELAAAWRVTAGLQQTRLTNDLPVVQEGDNSLKSAALGMRYLYPSGSYFGYSFRRGSGDYFNRVAPASSAIPTSLEEFEHELRLVWLATGKTTLTAKISHLEREHPGVAVRDYGGTVGSVNMDWGVSGKLRLATTLSRELSAYQTDTSSYLVADRVSVAPLWQLTAHTALRANYQYTVQNYRGALPGLAAAQAREDKIQEALIGLDWRPRETIGLSLSLQNTKRLSNTPGFAYKVNAATVGARISF